MYSLRPDFGFYNQIESQHFGAVLKRYTAGLYGKLGNDSSIGQLCTDMYTDPITGNAIHIHMLSLATIAAALIYLDTPNPPTPLPILPPIIQLPTNQPKNVNVMIVNPPNRTFSENPTPHTIDIDMHIKSPTNPLTNVPVIIPDPRSTTRSKNALREDAEKAANATTHAKSVAIVDPVSDMHSTANMMILCHTTAPLYTLNKGAAATNQIGNKNRPTKQNKFANTVDDKTGNIASTPPNPPKHLSKNQ